MPGESKTTLRFNITLIDSAPEVYRILEVPDWYSFYDLHLCIQASFGWENRHLFRFGSDHYFNGGLVMLPDPDEDRPLIDAEDLQVGEIFKEKGVVYFYEYDFGDSWRHRIEVHTVIREVRPAAFCIDGENECPPEDIGGIPGYLEILKVFASGTQAEKKNLREFLGFDENEDWNPGYFNFREVIKRMALVRP